MLADVSRAARQELVAVGSWATRQDCFERDLIDSALRDDLAQVTEVRKVSAHFKPPLTPNTVMLRAFERAETSTAQSDDELLDEVLQDDAMFALKVATKLIRGNQGLSRVRLY